MLTPAHVYMSLKQPKHPHGEQCLLLSLPLSLPAKRKSLSVSLSFFDVGLRPFLVGDHIPVGHHSLRAVFLGWSEGSSVS